MPSRPWSARISDLRPVKVSDPIITFSKLVRHINKKEDEYHHGYS
jgi:hypothetical protein